MSGNRRSSDGSSGTTYTSTGPSQARNNTGSGGGNAQSQGSQGGNSGGQNGPVRVTTYPANQCPPLILPPQFLNGGANGLQMGGGGMQGFPSPFSQPGFQPFQPCQPYQPSFCPPPPPQWGPCPPPCFPPPPCGPPPCPPPYFCPPPPPPMCCPPCPPQCNPCPPPCNPCPPPCPPCPPPPCQPCPVPPPCCKRPPQTQCCGPSRIIAVPKGTYPRIPGLPFKNPAACSPLQSCSPRCPPFMSNIFQGQSQEHFPQQESQQPPSYNNCNFYVTELPPGCPHPNNNNSNNCCGPPPLIRPPPWRRTFCEEEDDCCDDDCCENTTSSSCDRTIKSSEQDCKPFPRPRRTNWGGKDPTIPANPKPSNQPKKPPPKPKGVRRNYKKRSSSMCSTSGSYPRSRVFRPAKSTVSPQSTTVQRPTPKSFSHSQRPLTKTQTELTSESHSRALPSSYSQGSKAGGTGYSKSIGDGYSAKGSMSKSTASRPRSNTLPRQSSKGFTGSSRPGQSGAYSTYNAEVEEEEEYYPEEPTSSKVEGSYYPEGSKQAQGEGSYYPEAEASSKSKPASKSRPGGKRTYEAYMMTTATSSQEEKQELLKKVEMLKLKMDRLNGNCSSQGDVTGPEVASKEQSVTIERSESSGILPSRTKIAEKRSSKIWTCLTKGGTPISSSSTTN